MFLPWFRWILINCALRLTSPPVLLQNPPSFTEKGRDQFMSMHSSLKSATKIAAKRNVLKRFERVELLKAKGKWKAGDRAFGLPKTKSA